MKLDLDQKCKCLCIEVKNISKSYSLCILCISIVLIGIIISQLVTEFLKLLILLLLKLILTLVIPTLLIILFFFIVFILLPFLLSYVWQLMNEDNVPKDPTKEYAAVLISNAISASVEKCCVKRYWKNVQTNSAALCIYGLKRYFEKRKIDYLLIQEVTKKDLDEVVSNINCTELYLIGHGSRGVFKTSEKCVNYSEYNKPEYTSNKKKIVSQLHCNGLEYAENCIEDNKKNTSLTQILAINQKDSFLTEGYITLFDIYRYCCHLSRKK